MPVERVRSSRPGDESWRADAFAGSRHSRWVDELRQPLEIHDQERAADICAQVARLALQDFAPTLLLLATADRQRVQTLTAYCLTLFDFVRQTGLEGERLTAINRWEFDLEAALDGQPTGQPVFVQIHALELQQPWPRDGFDQLHALARRRCVQSRPTDRRAAERDATALGRCLAWLLIGQEPEEPLVQFASGLVRLRGLLDLGDDLRRHRARLPIDELPDSWSAEEESDAPSLTQAIQRECTRLIPILEPRDFLSQVPAGLKAAARYSQASARQLLQKTRSSGIGIVETPPRVGLLQRVGLLLRSRWL